MSVPLLLDQLHAAIALAALLGLVVGDGFGVAQTSGKEAGARDAVLLQPAGTGDLASTA
jgi:hypothetical protein